MPYAEQQFHALMTENGVLGEPGYDAAGTAELLRAAIGSRGFTALS